MGKGWAGVSLPKPGRVSHLGRSQSLPDDSQQLVVGQGWGYPFPVLLSERPSLHSRGDVAMGSRGLKGHWCFRTTDSSKPPHFSPYPTQH